MICAPKVHLKKPQTTSEGRRVLRKTQMTKLFVRHFFLIVRSKLRWCHWLLLLNNWLLLNCWLLLCSYCLFYWGRGLWTRVQPSKRCCRLLVQSRTIMIFVRRWCRVFTLMDGGSNDRMTLHSRLSHSSHRCLRRVAREAIVTVDDSAPT